MNVSYDIEQSISLLNWYHNNGLSISSQIITIYTKHKTRLYSSKYFLFSIMTYIQLEQSNDSTCVQWFYHYYHQNLMLWSQALINPLPSKMVHKIPLCLRKDTSLCSQSYSYTIAIHIILDFYSPSIIVDSFHESCSHDYDVHVSPQSRN